MNDAAYNIYLTTARPEFDSTTSNLVVYPGTVYKLWNGDFIKFGDRTQEHQVYYELYLKKLSSKVSIPDDVVIFERP